MIIIRLLWVSISYQKGGLTIEMAQKVVTTLFRDLEHFDGVFVQKGRRGIPVFYHDGLERDQKLQQV